METLDQIKKQQQAIAQDEQSLALAKLKNRRADTRHKIELGGLVIKSGMDGFNKSVILGGLHYLSQLIQNDFTYHKLFQTTGENLFKLRKL